MRELETQYGTTLFSRNARGMEPTEIGKMLLGHAERILTALEQAESDLSAGAVVASSTVRLGMPFSLAFLALADIIGELERHWPMVCLQMIEGFSGALAEHLITRRIDLAVFVGEPSDPRIAKKLLARERMCLVVPKSWKIAAADCVALKAVCRLPLVLPGRGHGIRALLDGHASVNGWTLNIAHELDSAYHLVTQVAHGSGVTVLTPYSAGFARSSKDVAVVPIEEPELWRRIFLGWPKNQNEDLPTRAVREIVERVLFASFSDLNGDAEWLA